MQILIDNLDGKGDVDNTPFVRLEGDAIIIRKLNKPSLFNFDYIAGEADDRPVSNARVTLKNSTGGTLFTGYICGQTTFHSLGYGTDGPDCWTKISAFSDESLFDSNPFQITANIPAVSAQQTWNTLSQLSAAPQSQPILPSQMPSCGCMDIYIGTTWAEAAGVLASRTRSAYRFLGGQLQIIPMAQNSHTVDLGDPGLELHPTQESDLRWLASDIILTGKLEPQAYVSEVFEGDGSTSVFRLSRPVFRPLRNDRAELRDFFQGKTLNSKVWSVTDSGSYISLTAGGLTCTGGTGRDSESIVASWVQIELAGAVTLEARGVCIGAGSSGQMLGLYIGAVNTSNCFVAFNVSSNQSSVVVQPVVNGAPAGSTFNAVAGRIYTFRIRINLPEMERVQQRYVYKSSPEFSAYGGGQTTSSATLSFDVQDVTTGIPSGRTTLLLESLESKPPVCILGLVNNINLNCSIQSVQYVQSGPLDVFTSVSGAYTDQQVGDAVDGAQCRFTAANEIVFYPDSIPASGALVYVAYRTAGRAVARRQSPNASFSSPRRSLLIGSVVRPAARSSVDCDNAALALMQISSDASSVLKGTYSTSLVKGDSDIWPGDALLIGPAPDGSYASSTIRQVILNLTASIPERLLYTIHFANDWAEDLSITVKKDTPGDLIWPDTSNVVSGRLKSLNSLKVISIDSKVVQIDTGMAAPVNGGFEVRRRDYTFGAETNSDFVLRVNTSKIAIHRTAAVEQYFIRMYDASTPPEYSLYSAAVFINVPL